VRASGRHPAGPAPRKVSLRQAPRLQAAPGATYLRSHEAERRLQVSALGDSEAAAANPARLSALLEYDILDTPPEDGFDDIVLVASALCDTPVALVSLVAEHRQWFKAKVGVEICETPLDQSVCAHGLSQTELLVIPDLSQDPRTCANPLVAGEMAIRFYAGAPLVTPDGYVLGMLCVIDQTPRSGGLTGPQALGLQALARQVMALLALRRTVADRDDFIDLQREFTERQLARAEASEMAQQVISARETHVRSAQAAGRIGTFEVDVAADRLVVSAEFCRLYGLPHTADHSAASLEAQVLPEDRALTSTLPSRLDGSAPPDVEYRIRRADDGQVRWISRRATFVRDAEGAVVKMFGTVHDVTERRLASERVDALLALGDRLRDAATAREVFTAAAETLGRLMHVARTGYADVDMRAGTITVELDWLGEGATSIAGRYSIGQFPNTIRRLSQGQDLAVANIPAAHWLDTDLPAYEAMGVRAQIKTPLIVRGELVGLLFVHDAAPRTWSKPDIEFVHNVADRTYSALGKVRAEAEQQVLNHELSHRLKNTLAMVQAIASQTLRPVADRGPVEAFQQRLHALSKAHDVLLEQSWTSASLQITVQHVLEMLGQQGRCTLAGPEVALSPKTTLSASLVIHELATNAIKYGALSTPHGQVKVAWALEPGEAGATLVLTWRETGGPPAVEPTRKGFGSRLIRMGFTGTGEVALCYHPEGFEAVFRESLAQVQQS
jgi:PAS domain S-box-containing protein